MNLDWLNGLAREAAVAELLKCCGSKRWAEAVAAARPFAGPEQLFATAAGEFEKLGEGDWLEAFRHHPKIGGKRAAAAISAQAQGWSEQEQSGTAGAARNTQEELIQANEEYERRFGYIFIVCASGKSAGEMLGILKSRLPNAPGKELRIAAREQAKITELRLKRLLNL